MNSVYVFFASLASRDDFGPEADGQRREPWLGAEQIPPGYSHAEEGARELYARSE